MDWDERFEVQQVVEAFLSVTIVAVSTAFIISNILGTNRAFIPLSLVFYSVVPLSMAMIGYLTYKVGRMAYESEKEAFSLLSPMLMSILLAVVAINIGFMILVSGSPSLNSIGSVRASYLIVVLSMALSLSVLIRNFFEQS